MEIQNFFIGGSSLTWQDYTVLLLLVAGMIFVGLYFGREEKSTHDFFLGGKKIPWWAACLSFVATEISAVTLIAVPAVAYMENWEYAQFFIGSVLARVVIAFLFIPAFYRYRCTSIYEFLQHRFGAATQIAGSLLFFITRLLASGVRLMVACLAVSILIGWSIIPTILLFSAICILYIAWGGIKAVVWTNVVQTLTFLLAGAVAIGFLLSRIDGGAAAVVVIAGNAGKLQVFNWGPAPGLAEYLRGLLSDPNIFFSGDFERLFWVHGGLRDRPGTHAEAAHGGNQASQPENHAADPHRQFSGDGHFPLYRRLPLCLLCPAARPAFAGQAGQNFSPFYRADDAPRDERADAGGHCDGQHRLAAQFPDFFFCHGHLPSGDFYLGY